MTVATLAAEILSRCGEGYENWTIRAKAAIKAAIYDVARSGKYGQADFFGLIHEGDYDPGSWGTSVELRNILNTANYEIISTLLLQLEKTDTTVDISLASYSEWIASGYNSELSAGINVWYLTADETGRFIKFGSVAPETDDVLKYAFVVWPPELATDETELSDYFAGGFISDVAEIATARLKKELLA